MHACTSQPLLLFGAGQAVKVEFGGCLETVKSSPGDQLAWLILDSQGSRPDFRCSQGVMYENLMVKILTAVAGGSTGDYVVSPLVIEGGSIAGLSCAFLSM